MRQAFQEGFKPIEARAMSEQTRKRLAERLREAREAKGLSQEEVATQLGIPRPAISQIENGRRRVEVLELARLAKLYERPMEFFAEQEPAGSNRFDVFRRAASALSDKDQEQVLRFAEFLRQQADQSRRRG
jgi:transcriptional regulator with XRE-family HTH domain